VRKRLGNAHRRNKSPSPAPTAFHPDHSPAYRSDAAQHFSDLIYFQFKTNRKPKYGGGIQIIRQPHFNAPIRHKPCGTSPSQQPLICITQARQDPIQQGFQFDSSHNQKIPDENSMIAAFVRFPTIDHSPDQ
jgi:hypothetical protein